MTWSASRAWHRLPEAGQLTENPHTGCMPTAAIWSSSDRPTWPRPWPTCWRATPWPDSAITPRSAGCSSRPPASTPAASCSTTSSTGDIDADRTARAADSERPRAGRGGVQPRRGTAGARRPRRRRWRRPPPAWSPPPRPRACSSTTPGASGRGSSARSTWACAAGSTCTGHAAAPPALAEAWPLALLPLVYIAAVTAVSRGEVHGGRRGIAAFALISLSGVLVALLALALRHAGGSLGGRGVHGPAGLARAAGLLGRVPDPGARADSTRDQNRCAVAGAARRRDRRHVCRATLQPRDRRDGAGGRRRWRGCLR